MKTIVRVSLAIVTITALVLTSCAPKPTPTPRPTPPTATPVPPTPTPKPITLRFISWRMDEAKWADFIDKRIKEFEAAHPGVTIEKISEPVEGYDDKLITAITVGEVPDIIHLTGRTLPSFVAKGWLAPLDQYMKGTDIKESYSKLQDFCVINGKTYAILVEAYVVGLIYNKPMLEEAGVEVPTTPDELLEAAKKLTRDIDGDGIIDVYGLAIRTEGTGIYFSATDFVIGKGGHFSKAGVPTANSPEVIAGVKQLKEFLDAGVTPLGLDARSTPQMLYEGKAAMVVGGPWVYTNAATMAPDMFPNLAVAPSPFTPPRGGVSNVLALPAGGKYNDLAWDFIQLWTTPEAQEEFTALGLPARKGVLTPAAVKDFPGLMVFGESLAEAVDRLPPGMEALWPKFSKATTDALQAIVMMDAPIEETLNELQAELEKIVAESE